MDKKEVIEVLETILDGLTAGESTEKKLEETKKFYETELTKVNKENRLYQSIIRLNLFREYVSFKRGMSTSMFEIPNGPKLFQHQMQAYDYYNNQPVSGSELDSDEFDKFVEDYLNFARKDRIIGIKE